MLEQAKIHTFLSGYANLTSWADKALSIQKFTNLLSDDIPEGSIDDCYYYKLINVLCTDLTTNIPPALKVSCLNLVKKLIEVQDSKVDFVRFTLPYLKTLYYEGHTEVNKTLLVFYDSLVFPQLNKLPDCCFTIITPILSVVESVDFSHSKWAVNGINEIISCFTAKTVVETMFKITYQYPSLSVVAFSQINKILPMNKELLNNSTFLNLAFSSIFSIFRRTNDFYEQTIAFKETFLLFLETSLLFPVLVFEHLESSKFHDFIFLVIVFQKHYSASTIVKIRNVINNYDQCHSDFWTNFFMLTDLTVTELTGIKIRSVKKELLNLHQHNIVIFILLYLENQLSKIPLCLLCHAVVLFIQNITSYSMIELAEIKKTLIDLNNVDCDHFNSCRSGFITLLKQVSLLSNDYIICCERLFSLGLFSFINLEEWSLLFGVYLKLGTDNDRLYNLIKDDIDILLPEKFRQVGYSNMSKFLSYVTDIRIINSIITSQNGWIYCNAVRTVDNEFAARLYNAWKTNSLPADINYNDFTNIVHGIFDLVDEADFIDSLHIISHLNNYCTCVLAAELYDNSDLAKLLVSYNKILIALNRFEVQNSVSSVFMLRYQTLIVISKLLISSYAYRSEQRSLYKDIICSLNNNEIRFFWYSIDSLFCIPYALIYFFVEEVCFLDIDVPEIVLQNDQDSVDMGYSDSIRNFLSDEQKVCFELFNKLITEERASLCLQIIFYKLTKHGVKLSTLYSCLYLLKDLFHTVIKYIKVLYRTSETFLSAKLPHYVFLQNCLFRILHYAVIKFKSRDDYFELNYELCYQLLRTLLELYKELHIPSVETYNHYDVKILEHYIELARFLSLMLKRKFNSSKIHVRVSVLLSHLFEKLYVYITPYSRDAIGVSVIATCQRILLPLLDFDFISSFNKYSSYKELINEFLCQNFWKTLTYIMEGPYQIDRTLVLNFVLELDCFKDIDLDALFMLVKSINGQHVIFVAEIILILAKSNNVCIGYSLILRLCEYITDKQFQLDTCISVDIIECLTSLKPVVVKDQLPQQPVHVSGQLVASSRVTSWIVNSISRFAILILYDQENQLLMISRLHDLLKGLIDKEFNLEIQLLLQEIDFIKTMCYQNELNVLRAMCTHLMSRNLKINSQFFKKLFILNNTYCESLQQQSIVEESSMATLLEYLQNYYYFKNFSCLPVQFSSVCLDKQTFLVKQYSNILIASSNRLKTSFWSFLKLTSNEFVKMNNEVIRLIELLFSMESEFIVRSIIDLLSSMYSYLIYKVVDKCYIVQQQDDVILVLTLNLIVFIGILFFKLDYLPDVISTDFQYLLSLSMSAKRPTTFDKYVKDFVCSLYEYKTRNHIHDLLILKNYVLTADVSSESYDSCWALTVHKLLKKQEQR